MKRLLFLFGALLLLSCFTQAYTVIDDFEDSDFNGQLGGPIWVERSTLLDGSWHMNTEPVQVREGTYGVKAVSDYVSGGAFFLQTLVDINSTSKKVSGFTKFSSQVNTGMCIGEYSGVESEIARHCIGHASGSNKIYVNNIGDINTEPNHGDWLEYIFLVDINGDCVDLVVKNHDLGGVIIGSIRNIAKPQTLNAIAMRQNSGVVGLESYFDFFIEDDLNYYNIDFNVTDLATGIALSDINMDCDNNYYDSNNNNTIYTKLVRQGELTCSFTTEGYGVTDEKLGEANKTIKARTSILPLRFIVFLLIRRYASSTISDYPNNETKRYEKTYSC